MFQILLVSHGNLAKEMLGACEMISGKQEGVRAVGLMPGMNGDTFGELLKGQMDEIYGDGGVLVFADLYGGTPCNSAVLHILTRYEKAEIISGMNLAMVLEAVSMRDAPLASAVKDLLGVGREDVLALREQLKKESAQSGAEGDE